MAFTSADIAIAIALVATSKLGKGLLTATECNDEFSRNRFNVLGPRLVRTLERLNTAGAITVGGARLIEAYGQGNEGSRWERAGILFAPEFETHDDILGLSALLVHEAVHVGLRGTDLFDEEVIAWGAQSAYIQELARGMALRSAHPAHPKYGSNVTYNEIAFTNYRNHCGFKARVALNYRHNIVDYLVAMTSYARTLNAQWIEQTRTQWGGLGNRSPKTLGRYLNLMIHASNSVMPLRTRLQIIAEIVESIPGANAKFQFGQWPPPEVTPLDGVDIMMDQIGHPDLFFQGFGRGAAALLLFLQQNTAEITPDMRARINRGGRRWSISI